MIKNKWNRQPDIFIEIRHFFGQSKEKHWAICTLLDI